MTYNEATIKVTRMKQTELWILYRSGFWFDFGRKTLKKKTEMKWHDVVAYFSLDLVILDGDNKSSLGFLDRLCAKCNAIIKQK